MRGAHQNDQDASSKEMNYTHGGATPWRVYKRAPKQKRDSGTDAKQTGMSDAGSLEKTSIFMNDTLTDLKESKGVVDNFLEQKTSAICLHKAKEDNTELPSTELSLGYGFSNYEVSRAESALASLYGNSERDRSVEFAVKLLMDETPLPTEDAEVEEFFSQKMNSKKGTTTSGHSQSQESTS
ncbi:hypothetical protein ACP70R_039177 [Stipagrostis hirtigluma subsp. patula]